MKGLIGDRAVTTAVTGVTVADRRPNARVVTRVLPPRAEIEPGTVWTPKVVEARIEAAVLTLGALSTGHRRSITQAVDVVHAASDAYGYTSASARIMPSGAQIDEAEAVMVWLTWLDARDRLIVWGRAVGIKWRSLERRCGFTERHLRTFRRNAILRIVARLNGVRG